MVNLSLTSGQVPDIFKVAMLKPYALLKKSGADHELFLTFVLSRIYIFFVQSYGESSRSTINGPS